MQKKPETPAAPVVFVIDDDASVRDAISSLIRSVGLRAEVFAFVSEFLAHKRLSTTSCLILDVRLPSVSGLEFQSELTKANAEIPIIFITGHGDIPMTVKAMKAGAVEFLTKPFRDQDLLDAIQVALERAPVKDERDRAVSDLKRNFSTLTPRILLLLKLSTMTSHSAMRARTEWPSDYRANSSFDEIAAAYCSPKAQEYADTG